MKFHAVIVDLQSSDNLKHTLVVVVANPSVDVAFDYAKRYSLEVVKHLYSSPPAPRSRKWHVEDCRVADALHLTINLLS